MAISDLANTSAAGPKKGPACTVCLALQELPEADAAGLLTLLADRSRRYTEIADRIHADLDTPEWIRNIHHATYARHAGGGCAARVKLR